MLKIVRAIFAQCLHDAVEGVATEFYHVAQHAFHDVAVWLAIKFVLKLDEHIALLTEGVAKIRHGCGAILLLIFAVGVKPAVMIPAVGCALKQTQVLH